jgi:LacI family transcriptional regulator, galactose operon repressor
MSGRKAGRSTMNDVARASGHSLSTVDRVLNGRSAVRADTAQQILTAAETLGYYAAGVIRTRIREVRPRRSLGYLLQRPDAAFYKALADSLVRATEACPVIRGNAVVEYVPRQSPELVAECIDALGAKVQALAVVVADHPLVTEAIERLHARGVPVFALISDLNAPSRAGFAGIDNRRLGRTAAWFIAELSHRPGKVVMYVGSPRFQCQELSEISFRSYMREYAPDFELLETVSTLESEEYGEERTHVLLQRHPDLCGFYMGGSGIEGALRALRAHKPEHRIVGVGNEITPVTRSGLQSGHFHVLLSHPLSSLCRELVDAMASTIAQPGGVFRQVLVPMEIHVPQSV